MSNIYKSGTGGGGGGITSVRTLNATPQFVLSGTVETIDFGIQNLLLGSDGSSITSAQGSTGYGIASLSSLNNGLRNSAFGAGSLQSLQGAFDNTAVGFQALMSNVSANFNVAVGSFALVDCTSPQNVAVGQSALGALTTQGGCVGVGYQALTTCTGGFNTGIGEIVLLNLGAGTNNIGIGNSAGSAYTSTESNNIVIGSIGTIADANWIRIGTQGSGVGQQNKCAIAGIVGVTVSNTQIVTINSSTGQLGVQSVNTFQQNITSSTINFKNTGATSIFTTTGNFLITNVIVYWVTLTGTTSGITFDLGWTSPTFNDFTSSSGSFSAEVNLSPVIQYIIPGAFAPGNAWPIVPSGQTFTINIGTADTTATTSSGVIIIQGMNV